MAKDIDLFERETATNCERDGLLRAADRFLELLGYPRSLKGTAA